MKVLLSQLSRFIGRAFPVHDIESVQTVHGRKGSHIQAEWTTPDHWAHNNYERSHLPQLCIRASGWKARLLALLVRPDPLTIPEKNNPGSPRCSRLVLKIVRLFGYRETTIPGYHCGCCGSWTDAPRTAIRKHSRYGYWDTVGLCARCAGDIRQRLKGN